MSKAKQLDNLGVSAFCESMGMMVRAGIRTDEAISLLGQSDQTDGVLGHALTQMNASVERGVPLAEAMEETGIFPEYALQMIRAGENAGRLEDILFRLSDYYRDQKTIAEKLRAAITYPAAMIVMIIAVLVIMLAMVLPAFSDVYNNLTGSLAASTFSYIRWAYGLCWAALAVMIVIVLALLIGRAMWNGSGRAAVEGFLRRFPVCASIFESMAMFRFTSALETFLASGEMQDNAVRDSLEMTAYEPVAAKLRRTLTHMDEGHSFAQAAYDEQIFEPVYGRMLLAGERSGSMEDILRRLTHLLEENCSHQVDRLVGTVEPLLSGILMVTVGLSLLSVMLPLIGMMNSIG
ncbi:MAG: type II secretion system F family protein [Mogibacterium sp.]|nr:type II secretion system F family protein [Mogibacterium sp.]